MVTAGFEAEMNKKVSFMLITIVSNGGPMRSVTAIESDGLMAKDRVATYKMGLQRIGCSNIIILNVMMLMAYTQNIYGGFTCRCILRIFVIAIIMLWMIILPFVSFIAMAMLMLMMI